jgi:hypothetical protein
MEKLVLDYSKWRCGGGVDNSYSLGEGDTRLLNNEGYQCCLGQWCSQIGMHNELLGKLTPRSLHRHIPFLTENKSRRHIDSSYPDSDLALIAMVINDNPLTTPLQKIEKLKNLLAEHEIQLEVINLPENEQ